MASEKYRETRYKVRIEAELLQGNKSVLKTHTINVSTRGAFLVTDEPPALRQLFRVRFVLPPHNAVVTIPCMAAHAVQVGNARRPAGIGIQLYGVGGVDGTRWQQFVRWIRTEHASAIDQTMSFCQIEAPDNTRLDPMFDGRIKLRFRTIEELHKLYETNLERGGLLLPTKGEVPQGTVMEMALVHPKDNSIFPLRGIVRANIQRKDFSGVSVALADLAEDDLDALYDFVHSDISITIDVTGNLSGNLSGNITGNITDSLLEIVESVSADPHDWSGGLR